MIQLTEEQKDFISDQLSNCNELLDDAEMIEWFIENGINRAIAVKIVNTEIGWFSTNPIYFINWENY